MTLTTYQKRGGVSDRGKAYEWLLCTFYALKFSLSKEVLDFEIFTNNVFFGDFDDVTLRVKYVDKSVKVFLIQSKHSENKKNVTIKLLTGSSDDYSFSKYIKSFENTLKLKNFYFILFTNNVANFNNNTQIDFESKMLLIKHQTCVGKGLLDTSNNQKKCSIFKFDTSDSAFFRQFYLYVNQRNDVALKAEIKNLLKTTVKTDIYSNLIHFMRQWWLGNFTLTKSDVITKIAELAFSPTVLPLSDEKCNEKTDLISEAIMKADLTLIDVDDVSKIWRQVKHDARTMILTANKYDLSKDDQTKILWYMNQAPLVVKFDDFNKNSVVASIKLLGRSKEKKKLVLLGNCGLELEDDLSAWKQLRNLSDILLTSELRRSIVQRFSCSLQGKTSIPLEDFNVFDSELTSLFCVCRLLQIALSNFNIAEDLEELPPAYKSRLFPKILLSYKVIDNIKKAPTLLSCKENMEAIQGKFYKRLVPASFPMNSDTIRHYLYGSQSEDMEKYSVSHHFRVTENYNLQWINTDNSTLKELQEYRRINTAEYFEESQINDHLHNKIKIVIAHTGGGKTSLLKSIKNQSPPNHFVIKINLKEHSTFFSKRDKVDNIWNYVINFTIKSRAYDDFAEKMLKNYPRKKIILMWDGYDELKEDSRENLDDYVKEFYKRGIVQWITSKCHFQKHLEKTFNVFAVEIVPFNKKQQDEYIKERCKVSNHQEFFENINLTDNSEYLGIPLQLYILTSIFNRNPSSQSIYTLTDMCQNFIDGNYTHSLKKTNKNVDLSDGFIQDGKRYRLQQYKITALAAYFPDLFKKLQLEIDRSFIEDLKERSDYLGLIGKVNSEGVVEFEYNIFMEFFCALWFSENLIKIDPILYDVKYRNVKFMFDLLLAKNCPIFVSILYKKYDTVHNLEIVKDSAGRSPLHVISTYGEVHPVINPSTERKMYYYYEFGGEKHEYVVNSDNEDFKSAVTYLASKCDPLEEDPLFQWTSYHYADQSLSLGVIETLAGPLDTILPTLHNYSNSTAALYYSTRLSYTNLFNTIFQNITYVEYEDGYNLIHVAAEYGREEFLKHLLKHLSYFKFINKSNSYKWTPIHFASFHGHLSILKHLKESGGTFRLCEPSTLSLATTNQYQKVIEYLMECEVSPNDFYHRNYFTQSLPIAINRGYLDIVKFLVHHGAKLYKIGKNATNALHMALEYEQMDIAKFLLSVGVDVDDVDDTKRNSYHHAAMNNKLTVVEFLLENKADFLALDKDERSALHYAAQFGSSEIAEILVKKGLGVNGRDTNGFTPLHLAVQYGQVAIMRMLIAVNCEIAPADRYGRTPIHYAALNGLVECIETLLDKGSPLEAEDLLYNRRPLHYAAWNGHEDCVDRLIKKRAEIDARCHFLYTPLHLAADSQSFECCELLIKAHADVFLKNKNGKAALRMVDPKNFPLVLLFLEHYKYPIHEAINLRIAEVIPELVRRGYNVDEFDESGLSPLQKVVDEPHNFVFIETLLEMGADFKITDSDGYVPLHCALQSRFLTKQAIEVFLNKDVDNLTINQKTNRGLTPLHIASQAGSNLQFRAYDPEIFLDLVQLLLERGADIGAEDDEGFTPFHYAATGGNLEIAKLLLKKGLQIDKHNKRERTALHLASTQGRLLLVKFLLNENASTDLKDKDGDTPLDDALKAEHPKVFKVLLEATSKTVPVDVTNFKGRTLLHMAIKQNFEDLVEEYLSQGASVDVEDCNGNTPIDEAFYSANFKLFSSLLKRSKKFDVNKYNKHYKSYYLHVAAAKKSLNLVNVLLNKGARVDVVDDEGETPLHKAAKNNEKEIVQKLAENDTNAINITNKLGQTVLHILVKARINKELVKFLVDRGARIDIVDADGNVPFDICFQEDHPLIYCEELLFNLENFDVEKKNKTTGQTLLHYSTNNFNLQNWLIKKRPSINCKDNNGNTPLHLAARHLFLEEYGRDIDFTITNNKGETALHCACETSFHLVKTMIDLGASVDATTNQGKTPIDYALEANNAPIFKFLLEQKPKVDVSNIITREANTPLHLAASFGDLELVKTLLEGKLSIKDVNKYGKTPLRCAVDVGHVEVLKLLLEKDKKATAVNMADSEGNTLLHVAAEIGKLGIVRLLVKSGANLDVFNDEGETPRDVAVKEDNTEVQEFLEMAKKEQEK